MPKSKNATINAGSNANTRDKRFVEAVVAEDSLYDLSADPSEKRNLVSEYPQVAEALKRRLKEIVDSK